MTEVKIGLGTVMRDKHFTVLERAHRAWINVDVRIELDHADCQATRFQNGAKTRRSDPLSERGNHAASNENIRCHGQNLNDHKPKQQRAGSKHPNGLVLFSNP